MLACGARSRSIPSLPAKRYARKEKRSVEQELSGLVAALSSEPTRTAFLDGSLDAARVEELGARLRPAFKRLLRLTGLPLEAVYDARFVDSTRRFLQAARDFDPDLGLASAFQALRNVWIMNSLQFDLGLPVEHTDAIFAYSMVYPYLDNMLDDARTAEAGKLAFVTRLRSWLEGASQAAESPRQEKLLSLVRLIERRFPRPEFPGALPVPSDHLQRPGEEPASAETGSGAVAGRDPGHQPGKGRHLGPRRRLPRRRGPAPARRGVLFRFRDHSPTGRRPPGYRRRFPMRPPDPFFVRDGREPARCDGPATRILSRRGPRAGPPGCDAEPVRPLRRHRERPRR